MVKADDLRFIKERLESIEDRFADIAETQVQIHNALLSISEAQRVYRELVDVLAGDAQSRRSGDDAQNVTKTPTEGAQAVDIAAPDTTLSDREKH